MATLILQPVRGGCFLRTRETATEAQHKQAALLGIQLASQRGKGVRDLVVGQIYASAAAARSAAEELRPKVQVITAQRLRAILDSVTE